MPIMHFHQENKQRFFSKFSKSTHKVIKKKKINNKKQDITILSLVLFKLPLSNRTTPSQSH